MDLFKLASNHNYYSYSSLLSSIISYFPLIYNIEYLLAHKVCPLTKKLVCMRC